MISKLPATVNIVIKAKGRDLTDFIYIEHLPKGDCFDDLLLLLAPGEDKPISSS